jgi:hypothetical protein
MGTGADREPHQQARAKSRERPETEAPGTGLGTLNFLFGIQREMPPLPPLVLNAEVPSLRKRKNGHFLHTLLHSHNLTVNL